MSKGQYLSNHQKGIVNRYYENQDTIVLGKLSELASELYLCDDPKKAATHWKSVQLALKKTSIDPLRAARIVNEKRTEDLAAIVQELSKPGAKILANKPGAPAATPATDEPPARTAPIPGSAFAAAKALHEAKQAQENAPSAPSPTAQSAPAPAAASPAPTAPTAAAPTPDQLKGALTAFKKRLKLTRLNDESKLSSRALTGGKKSTVSAIQPPYEYPKACWDELVKQGKLRYTGSGLYELLEP